MNHVTVDALRAKVALQRAKTLKKNFRLLRVAVAMWNESLPGYDDKEGRDAIAHIARQIARENNFPLPAEFAP